MSDTVSLIKNASPEDIGQTLGNTGALFPYNTRFVPEEDFCPFVLQENRRIAILTVEGDYILFDCLT